MRHSSFELICSLLSGDTPLERATDKGMTPGVDDKKVAAPGSRPGTAEESDCGYVDAASTQS
jgi:hypothetical protein